MGILLYCCIVGAAVGAAVGTAAGTAVGTAAGTAADVAAGIDSGTILSSPVAVVGDSLTYKKIVADVVAPIVPPPPVLSSGRVSCGRCSISSPASKSCLCAGRSCPAWLHGTCFCRIAAEAVGVVDPLVVPAEISSCLYRTVETDILR